MNPISLTFLVVSLIAFLGGAAHGQEPALNDQQHSAPVKWTEYRIASQKLSILVPKLPLVRGTSDLCSQMEGALYYAYAAGVIYELEWRTKGRNAIPKGCPPKTTFSKAAFTNRLEELRDQGYLESDETVGGVSAKVLRWASTSNTTVKTRWLLWQEDRWLELGIATRKGTPVDPTRFLGGLKLSSSSGQDIGKGSLSTLGDADVDLKSDFDGKDPEGMVVFSKPRSAYTEAARKNNIQGSVVLRVTFLSSGCIGPISVVKALPQGLTEQAIAAARRISFLPATVNGNPVSATKQVEYIFSIY